MKKFILFAFCCASAAGAAEVNLYADRQEVFLRPVLAAFREETGIKVNVLFAKNGLLERMRAEGESSPADAIMAVDAGRLQDFVAAGLTAPHHEADLRALLQPDLSAAHWVAVTRRARVLFARKETDIEDYDGLAAPGVTVCMRSGLHPYNIALIADFIARHGADGAKKWLAGVRDNLARKPQGNDRAQINAVIDGECDVGVANSYYHSKLAEDPERRAAMERTIKIIIPPAAHVNITGVALAAHAPNRENALRLMRFLLSKPAQELYARANGEFPARDDVEFPADWRRFREAAQNAAPLANIARHRAAASRLVDEVGFDR